MEEQQEQLKKQERLHPLREEQQRQGLALQVAVVPRPAFP
jgi:hypothetical protein